MNTWPILLLLLLGLIGHFILWTALVNRSHALGVARWIVDTMTLACGLAVVAIPAAIAWESLLHNPPRLGDVGIIYLILCSLVVVWSAIDRWLLRRADHAGELLQRNHTHAIDLRRTHGDALLAPGIVRLLGGLPGNQVLRIQVHEKQLIVPGLPEALDGLRIAHLSDLHMSGRLALEYYAAIVERVNLWEPDIVAITGDIIETDLCIDWISDTVGTLHGKNGVYFVLGNHDRQADHEKIRRELVADGLCDLGGQSTELTVCGERVLLAGNELPWFPMKQEIGGKTATFRLLLAHGPDQLAWAKQRGFHLMLAGHNHGGQICFPFVGAIVAPSLNGTRFAGGVFRRGDTLLHVSRGAGSLSPLRWNCPPEIALLTLRKQGDREQVTGDSE